MYCAPLQWREELQKGCEDIYNFNDSVTKENAEDMVICIDMDGIRGGVWGSEIAMTMMEKGVSGVVVDGGCRDSYETNLEGAPVFYLSLYDYWNEGSENLLYLYVGGIGTGEYDYSGWPAVEIKTKPMLFELGGTGTGNIIASIFNATPASEIGGLPPIEFPNFGYDDWSMPRNVSDFVGCYRVQPPVSTPITSVSFPANDIAACVNRLG